MNTLKLILLSASLIAIFGLTDFKPDSAVNKENTPEEIFTIKEVPVKEMNIPSGSSAGYSSLQSVQDSIIYENDSVFTIESYKEELSKDGEWIKVEKDEIDPEGVSAEAGEDMDGDINREWIWRPHIYDPDWTPYTNGYWVYTNCGWMWISSYHWGWRTCHYGRWWWSSRWGWVWSPGFIWAPAWVVWMYYDGYCGWYPISPRIRWHKHYGWRCHKMRFRVRHWRFCHNNNFTVHLNKEVIIDPPRNKEIIDKATFRSDMDIADKRVINKGPDIKTIETAINKKIAIDDVTKYNNVKTTLGRDDEKKNYQGEKKTYNDNEKYRNNDQGYKNNDDGYRNNEGNNNDGYKNNDGNKNDGYRNNDGNKNSDRGSNDQNRSNDNTRNNDNKKSNDQNRSNETKKNSDQNRGSEKKSNDYIKKDYKEEKPQDNNRKQDPPPKDDGYKKQYSPPNSNDSYKKQESPPESGNNYRKEEQKQSSPPVNKDDKIKKDNNKTENKGSDKKN